MISDAEAGDHKVYGGLGLTHWSNVDVGEPFNDAHEDNGDHVGISLEYQYHMEDVYVYTSLGIGRTIIKTRDQNGWDCSGCDYPSEIRVGIKWRLF